MVTPSSASRGLVAPATDALRRRATARTERLTATKAVRQAIVSVAGLIGAPVSNLTGQRVGKVIDLVARMHPDDRYPPLTGVLVRIGRRTSFMHADAIAAIEHRAVRLTSARLDLRDFIRRPGEVLLGKDVLDHQLVDIDGRQVIRAADPYLAPVAGQIRLVGLDTRVAMLLCRLGSRALRGRPTPDRVIDWDAVARSATICPRAWPPCGCAAPMSSSAGCNRTNSPTCWNLGRPGRQDLLRRQDPAAAADALEEMDPDELQALLREANPDQAAALVAVMEPDEAVDALRGPDAERDNILQRMPEQTAHQLRELLVYPGNKAGGFRATTRRECQATDRSDAGPWANNFENHKHSFIVC